jgi:predicted alpha/beta hydrolase family esterase
MKYLIMHGSYTKIDNPKYWFNWLKKELVNLGGSVISDQFPTEDWSEVEDLDSNKASTFISKQSLISWENKFITDVLPHLGSEPFVFIGHSIAPVFMLHMLQKYDFHLAGAIFVSPFFDIPDRPEIWQFYPTNKTFYNYDFNFAKIKSQILGKTYVVYGDNDPYVPATEPPLFAEKLDSELIVVPNGSHCGSIFKEFPLVLELSQK